MKQRKHILGAVVLLVVILLAAVFLLRSRGGETVQEGVNLLENADFSQVTGGMPDGWDTGMWITSTGTSYLQAVTLEDGTTAALIENAAANDARFEQRVSVKENTIYRLTARVLAEGCGTATGANVSFLDIYGTSDPVYDTQGEWQTVTLYGRTGKGQKEITVCVRLGGYGGENTGRAWFTDVELVEVASAPEGAYVLSLATPTPAKETDTTSARDAAIPLLLGAAAVYLLLAGLIIQAALRPSASDRNPPCAALALLLVLAGVLRLALAFNVEGYGVDMGCFVSWAGRMATGGPANFYAADYFCDYPPAYMLVLGLLGLIAQGLQLTGQAMQTLIKLVPIACDIGLAGLAYAAARRRLGARVSLGLAALMALNPAFIVTGSCWGQIDSVLTLLLLAMLLAAQAGQWHVAIPVFALAVLTKPQAGLLAPLGAAALIKECLGHERAMLGKRILLGLGLGVAVTLCVVLPFSIHQASPLWLVDTYVETLSSYDYATLSTGNLMFLLGGNWTANTEPVLFGITYGQLGLGLMLLAFAAGIAVYLRGEGRSRLFTAGALTMQMIFVLGSKMHERYILPALGMLLLAYLETGDLRLLLAGVLSSAASAVNIGVVLAFEYLISPNLWLGYGIGVVQLISLGLTLWAAVDALRGRVLSLPPRQPRAEQAEEAPVCAAELRMRDELLHAPDAGLHMRARDWAIMLALTAAYAVVGFWNLGVTTAPQTGYASTAAGESVVIDLGEQREDFAIYYYGGISDVAFSVAVSNDGVTFIEENDAKYLLGDCFKWQAVRSPVYDESGRVKDVGSGMLTFSGRYVRITFRSAGASLWEVAAVDADGNVYPAVSATASGALEGREADPNALIDEQDTVPDQPSYLNSMYFDEIYHARTGYEHANSLYTYETTHPPLGKVFMSWCIRLMGMTPFAWRFAGALVGVLMIPAIYLLAKQLFGRTRFAALCAALLSLDCMHYTQTRIATIDSFPVLFIILTFLCMARWTKMSFYHAPLWRTLVPLALSGFFMGLAIASKWIGCYSAVGLAVLFFARFYTLWRQSVYARAHRHEDPAFDRAARTFARNGALTIVACVGFFVIVPVVIYCLSYIPYLSAYGEVKWNLRSFQRIWDNQLYMYRYHTELVADAEHYFSSPWYEWPLIIKPMWYYNADFKGAGMASSILSFGNPAVWWTGLAGIIFVLLYSLYRNAMPALRVIPGREDGYDRAMPVIAVGFLSAYLPWVMVTRLTFIYHYFASVPFIILATAQGLRYLERRFKKLAWALMILLVAAALVLFIAFFPLASGLEVPRAWCDAVSWFRNWMWY